MQKHRQVGIELYDRTKKEIWLFNLETSVTPRYSTRDYPKMVPTGGS